MYGNTSKVPVSASDFQTLLFTVVEIECLGTHSSGEVQFQTSETLTSLGLKLQDGSYKP
jgi:hypothetical protein